LISNNNELPKFEDIFDPADDFEFIDKKEVERLMKEDQLKVTTKKKIYSTNNQVKFNYNQVKSSRVNTNQVNTRLDCSNSVKPNYVSKPVKKSNSGKAKLAIAVIGVGLEILSAFLK